MNRFHSPSLGLLLFALAMSPATAQPKKPTAKPPAAQCFRLDVDEAHGPIKRIQVDYGKKDFTVEQWGAPGIRYVMAANCTPGKNGVLSCGTECEGGGASLSIRRDGVLVLDAEAFPLYAEVKSALPGPGDVDAAVLTGLFNLPPVSDQLCGDAIEANQRPELDLRKGEFEPRIKELEQMLVDLGYLARRPSWYFTGKTEAAIAQFQRAIGSKSTGVADAETVGKLRMTAAVRGGSC